MYENAIDLQIDIDTEEKCVIIQKCKSVAFLILHFIYKMEEYMGRSGSYSTEKRIKILEYLKQHSHEDVCVRDIEEHLNKEDGTRVNVTTIYRYLDKLAKDGQVLKHTGENGNKASFQYINPQDKCHRHLHMKCSGCGRIFHLDCSFMNEFQKHIYEHHHFIVECKTSMLYGICEECRIRQED